MTAARSSDPRPRVTLLTDFGTADGYAAAMKGVIAARAPGVRIDDASHDIEAGDIEAGAVALLRYWRLYPAGTIHVVVIDPGVGSARRPLAVEAESRFLVGPDNGVLGLALATADDWTAVEIANRDLLPARISNTFHGRDVFAPAAGHLAAAGALDALGPRIDEVRRTELPAPRRDGGRIQGVIIAVDRFGNLISNVPASWVGRDESVRVGGQDVGRLRRTYTVVPPGELVALEGSLGFVEISVRDGSAWERLGTGRGAGVLIQ